MYLSLKQQELVAVHSIHQLVLEDVARDLVCEEVDQQLDDYPCVSTTIEFEVAWVLVVVEVIFERRVGQIEQVVQGQLGEQVVQGQLGEQVVEQPDVEQILIVVVVVALVVAGVEQLLFVEAAVDVGQVGPDVSWVEWAVV